MYSFLHDIRFGLRILLRTPGVTFLVLLALALGIGANSAMFSVVDALLLHPLRYEDPSTLMVIWDRDAQGAIHSTSAGNYLDWREARSFSQVAGWAASNYVLNSGDRPAQITGARVTGNFFDTLGVKPLLGRTFVPGEDGLDGAQSVSHLAVISYGLWQGALGGDPNVLGHPIRLNDAPYDVIGVMPEGFEFLIRGHQVWVPAVLDPAERDYRYITVLARLAAPRPQAAGEMAAISQSLAQRFPEADRGWTAQIDNFQQWLVDRTIRTRLLLLFAAVGLVLLLACSNVASLLLARSAARQREMALRVALGATPGRIIAQVLTESVVLSLAGGLVGLGLAALLIRAAPSFVPASAIPTTAPIELNTLAIVFTLGISVLTGIVFGLAPALAASRPDVRETLQDSSRGSTGGRARQLFRQVMVSLEVAVALMLLASALLMVKSMQQLATADLGLNINNILAFRVFLPATQYDSDRSLRFNQDALEKVSALPGVQEAALATRPPLMHLGMEIPFDLSTTPPRPLAEMPGAGYVSISPDYLRTLGIPLQRGRDFDNTDTATAPKVVIVSEAFARRYFPSADPIGKRLRMNEPRLGSNGFSDTFNAEIVGVAGDVTLDQVGAPPEPIVYAPMAQNIWSTAHWLIVKTAGDPDRLAPAVRDTVVSMAPDQPFGEMTSMEEIFSTQFAEPRFQSGLMGAFAGLALVLAVVGIYGVNAYAVTQRRREIGVRMALGATPSDVVRDLVRQGMKLTGTGILLGMLGALAMRTVLSSVLLDVSATDPLPLLGAAALLAIVAFTACYLPARKATHVDPALVLRED